MRQLTIAYIVTPAPGECHLLAHTQVGHSHKHTNIHTYMIEKNLKKKTKQNNKKPNQIDHIENLNAEKYKFSR